MTACAGVPSSPADPSDGNGVAGAGLSASLGRGARGVMSTIGEREIRTQQRVVTFFQAALGYAYLGNWQDRDGNSNIEETLLTDWLTRQGYNDKIIAKVLSELDKATALGGSKTPLRRQPAGLRPAALRRENPAGRGRAEHDRLAD